MFGVLERSILASLLFTVFICDLFLIIDKIDIASYADNNVTHCTGKSIKEVNEKLDVNFKITLKNIVLVV